LPRNAFGRAVTRAIVGLGAAAVGTTLVIITYMRHSGPGNGRFLVFYGPILLAWFFAIQNAVEAWRIRLAEQRHEELLASRSPSWSETRRLMRSHDER
jgi:hypothetical protein